MNNSWNKRYSAKEYVYGTEPNEFFKEEINKLKPGRVLFLGEGEGRNAVFAASKGWRVDAVDGSSAGKEKALNFASTNNVKIDYTVADLSNYQLPQDTYDAIISIFLHLPEELREKVHASAVKALKTGGSLILEAFEKDQIKCNSGGPRNEDLLYSLEDIYSDFQELEIDKFSKESIHLSEGKLHDGEAFVIRYKGTKPK